MGRDGCCEGKLDCLGTWGRDSGVEVREQMYMRGKLLLKHPYSPGRGFLSQLQGQDASIRDRWLCVSLHRPVLAKKVRRACLVYYGLFLATGLPRW